MRSRLLIPVAHLPTISEDGETNSHREDSGAERLRHSNGLEEYVKSIQTLAQPCSLSSFTQPGQARSQRRSRQRLRPSRTCDGKVLSPAQDATGLQVDADPIAWLYRQSGKENTDSQKYSSQQTWHTHGPVGHYKVVVAPRRQPCGKDLSGDTQRAPERRSRPHRLQKKCRSGGSGTSRRLLAPQLPVIYEL